MKRKVLGILIVLTILIAIFLIIFGIFKVYNHYAFKQCTWHDGDTSHWDGQFDDKEAYDLALNVYNMPVFKNPDKALEQLQKDYKEAIDEIQKEFNITFTLSKYNYEIYGTYGCQLTSDNAWLRHQGKYVFKVLDIYENSFMCKVINES